MSTNPMTRESARRTDVADNVRAELARHNIVPKQLAGLTGRHSDSAWSRRMRAETPLDVDDLLALSDLLGVSVAVFFGLEVPPPRRPGGTAARRPTGPYEGQLVLLPNLDDLHSIPVAHPDAA